MKIKYMLELEVPAIVSSIINEVADYYMVSYANQLKNCKFPEDADNIDKKANEDLFFNMKNHTKNKQVLLDLKIKLT